MYLRERICYVNLVVIGRFNRRIESLHVVGNLVSLDSVVCVVHEASPRFVVCQDGELLEWQ